MFVCVCFWWNNEHLCVYVQYVCVLVACWVSICMYPIMRLCVVSVGEGICVHAAWKREGKCACLCRLVVCVPVCVCVRERAREMAWQWYFSCSNQAEYSSGPVYLSLPVVCPHASSPRSGGGLHVCTCVCAEFSGCWGPGREQADLVSWTDPRKRSQQCTKKRADISRDAWQCSKNK